MEFELLKRESINLSFREREKVSLWLWLWLWSTTGERAREEGIVSV
jgi:hypothetical protein